MKIEIDIPEQAKNNASLRSAINFDSDGEKTFDEALIEELKNGLAEKIRIVERDKARQTLRDNMNTAIDEAMSGLNFSVVSGE